MSYESQDVIQEAPSAPLQQATSLQSEAYSLMSPQSFDANQDSARGLANATFGNLELFGDDASFANHAGAGSKAFRAGDVIDAAVTQSEDDSMVLEYKNGEKTVVSPDGKVKEFDENGKEIKDVPAAPVPTSDDINKALEDLLKNGTLPDLEIFLKPNVPRNDGIIRQHQELDSNGNLNKVTEYPNGVSISKHEANIRGEDGKLRKEEQVIVKFPEGAQQLPDGTVVNKDGKPIFKDNNDGSRTVFMNNAQGEPETVTEYPNGVRISKGEPKTIDKDGVKITVDGGRTIIFPEGASKRPDGTVVDTAGRPIMKENADGSVNVFTDEGTYTQTADGKRSFKPGKPAGR